MTGLNFYDANRMPIGSSVLGSEYGVVATPRQALPAAVSVGDTGIYGLLTAYTDSTKTTSTGTRQFSFVVQADSTSTALVVFITRSFNTANQLTLTQQSTFRMTASGSLTLVSIDFERVLPSALHVVYTKV